MSNIRVIVRFRPLNEREKRESASGASFQLSANTVTVLDGKEAMAPFAFDFVFGESSTQQDVYERAAKDTIVDVLNGYNGTIFAYGQTGSGKSHSMFGPKLAERSQHGVIPRACEHIFNHIDQDDSGTEYTIKCSFLEIYMESVKDLLAPNSGPLRVRETPQQGVWVENLSSIYVSSQDEIYELLRVGEQSRAVSSTDMNSVSSRSHSLFVVEVTQKLSDGSTKVGRLNLADLAGCEKVGKTNARGETLEVTILLQSVSE
jgi:kinesin family protein 5